MSYDDEWREDRCKHGDFGGCDDCLDDLYAQRRRGQERDAEIESAWWRETGEALLGFPDDELRKVL